MGAGFGEELVEVFDGGLSGGEHGGSDSYGIGRVRERGLIRGMGEL